MTFNTPPAITEKVLALEMTLLPPPPMALKSAKVWGSAQFDGQTVKRDHVLQDKDVVELHM